MTTTAKPAPPRTRSVTETGRIVNVAACLALGRPSLEAGSRLSRMGQNVLVSPSAEIESGPRRQEFETRLRHPGAIFPRQHGVEPAAQGVQMQHVGGGIGELRIAQRLRPPDRC